MHTLQILKKGESDVEASPIDSVSVKWEYNKNSDSFIRIEVKENLKPNEQIIITFKIRKPLSNFEDYPNDIARGFNIPHMPVFYKMKDKV